METNDTQNIYEKPMTLGDWIVTYLLLMIPIANIVLMFVWAFGSNVNKSKKTFFQANLIFAAVWLVICIILFAVIGSALSNLRY